MNGVVSNFVVESIPASGRILQVMTARLAVRLALLCSTLFPIATAHSATALYSLELKDGKLTGPGADLLRTELTQAQFILWGEDHGMADSPILLRALAREARPLGFRYHVTETGPISVRLVDEALAHRGLPALHALVHQNPLALPFLSLKEDAELASDFTGVDSKGTPFLWGVDQEFIGSPSIHLQRLVVLAPNESARAAAHKLLEEEIDAVARGAQDKFFLSRFHDVDFDALAAQFNDKAEAQTIIAELRESASVYQAWMSGHNYENNARRARLLAKNFLGVYKTAADSEPKVIFKMGVEHVALGTTNNNTVDLGSLATSIARLNGKSALRIAFIPAGGKNLAFAPKPGNPTSVENYESPEAKELFAAIAFDPATLPKNGWSVIPLEPVRQALDTKGIDALKPFARFIVLGFDYLVTTPDAKPATSLY